MKETSDTLRGPKVNARKHWDGESWILEDAKTRKPLLIGTRSQILDEYDRRIDTPPALAVGSVKGKIGIVPLPETV